MKKILSTILIILILILSLLVYSRFIGIKGLNTNEIIIEDTIPESYNNLKIIHFADIHYKKVITEKEIKNLIIEINKTKPDLVFFTGDLTDEDYQLKTKDINFLIKELSKIETKYGSYAILGDQDINNREIVNNIYIQSNFTLLENTSTIIQNEQNDKILLIGLTNSKNEQSNIKEIIKPTSNNISYKIILTHEPDTTDIILREDNTIPLILSSHSINGSINIPIIKKFLLPENAKKYYKPHYQINNTNLYITNGIGLNQINFRLFNKPSINLYKLKKK